MVVRPGLSPELSSGLSQLLPLTHYSLVQSAPVIFPTFPQHCATECHSSPATLSLPSASANSSVTSDPLIVNLHVPTSQQPHETSLRPLLLPPISLYEPCLHISKTTPSTPDIPQGCYYWGISPISSRLPASFWTPCALSLSPSLFPLSLSVQRWETILYLPQSLLEGDLGFIHTICQISTKLFQHRLELLHLLFS